MFIKSLWQVEEELKYDIDELNTALANENKKPSCQDTTRVANDKLVDEAGLGMDSATQQKQNYLKETAEKIQFYSSFLSSFGNLGNIPKYRAEKISKLQKALSRPTLELKILKSFEVGGINQHIKRFDRLLSECASATLILGSSSETSVIQLDMGQILPS